MVDNLKGIPWQMIAAHKTFFIYLFVADSCQYHNRN